MLHTIFVYCIHLGYKEIIITAKKLLHSEAVGCNQFTAHWQQHITSAIIKADTHLS